MIIQCEEEHDISDLCNDLPPLLKDYPKRVFLIAPTKHHLVEKLKDNFQKQIISVEERMVFSDLTEDSQQKLFNKEVTFQGNLIALNQLVDKTPECVSNLISISNLLENKSIKIGNTVPIFKGYDKCYYIDRTFRKHNRIKFLTEYFLAQLKNNVQKLMIISATAGMGKSTLLTDLSLEIKKNNSNFWVVRIDLNDHTDALAKEKDKPFTTESAVDFISSQMLKLETSVDQELFKHLLDEGRVVVMLDGFDEISPTCKITGLDLIKRLRETKVRQLWVTTRPHLKAELEGKLKVESFCLEPFSKDN